MALFTGEKYPSNPDRKSLTRSKHCVHLRIMYSKLFSRAVFRSAILLTRAGSKAKNVLSQRNAGGHGQTFGYREPNYRPQEMKREVIMTNLLGGFAWWWVLYHVYYETGHLLGEFDYVNPSKDFTDQELGVPDDSEGLAPTIAHVRSTQIPGASPRTHTFSPAFLERTFGDTGVFKF
ncbi:NADH dehydrogenase [ubiquinone] 1 beta subcomplex subunit 2, mitochondrial [Halotydeus destructor]|nr:NADH dehydrogenase [ubiquinone] 1 beta subcomplex subunit 2, mitochondrial [Halotydeus destructor]